MRHRLRHALALALGLATTGCALGVGAMAPGVDEWVFATSYSSVHHRDPVGHEWDTYHVADTDSVQLAWGISGGGRMGVGLVALDGAERSSWALAYGFDAQVRSCRRRTLCLGLDAGYLQVDSDMTRTTSGGQGAPTTQQLSVGVRGWTVLPQLQVRVADRLWLEGGLGGAKTRIGIVAGSTEHESPAAWTLAWNAGLGVVVTPFLGVRLGVTGLHAAGTVEGVVDGSDLDASGSAWTLQFLID